MVDEPVWLERTLLDRCAEVRLRDGAVVEALAKPSTRVLEVAWDKVAGAIPAQLTYRAPQAGDADAVAFLIGRVDVGSVVGVVVDKDAPGLVGLRELASELSPTEAMIAGTAVSLATNHARFPYCPRCGQPNAPYGAGWVRRCAACGLDSYPRTDPVVIFSVISADGERIALSRGHNFAPGRFSCPAGFVDACEHPVESVAREALEELGVRVSDVQQVAMQPWPMNLQLMMGFTCQTHDETLVPQEDEVADARWFTRDELRTLTASGKLGLPGRFALGRVLVERFVGDRLTLPGESPGTVLAAH